MDTAPEVIGWLPAPCWGQLPASEQRGTAVKGHPTSVTVAPILADAPWRLVADTPTGPAWASSHLTHLPGPLAPLASTAPFPPRPIRVLDRARGWWLCCYLRAAGAAAR